MGRDNVLVIGKLQRAGSIGFNTICERIWAEFSRFSISNILPHSPSIFALMQKRCIFLSVSIYFLQQYLPHLIPSDTASESYEVKWYEPCSATPIRRPPPIEASSSLFSSHPLFLPLDPVLNPSFFVISLSQLLLGLRWEERWSLWASVWLGYQIQTAETVWPNSYKTIQHPTYFVLIFTKKTNHQIPRRCS